MLILGGLTACAGMLVASLAPDVWLALAGFAATGLGLANLFPVTIARVGLLAGSSGVALTSTLGYSGFLLGPPAIGFLASAFGLRAGLTTLSFLALAAAVIAWRSRDTPELSDGASLPAACPCLIPADSLRRRGCRVYVALNTMPVVAARQRADGRARSSHSDTSRTRTYGVDVSAMQLERHG